jgi:hypothetical protein
MNYAALRNASNKNGNANVYRLKDWIANTPLAEVPRNVYGKSARVIILRMLQIPRSAMQHTGLIAAWFDDLDNKLAKVVVQPATATMEGLEDDLQNRQKH